MQSKVSDSSADRADAPLSAALRDEAQRAQRAAHVRRTYATELDRQRARAERAEAEVARQLVLIGRLTAALERANAR